MTNPERRLTSWKAIAAYLGREVRTVTRWEKERDLPVHRGPTRKSGVVLADMDELDVWMRGGTRPPEAVPPHAPLIGPTPRALTRRWFAAAATMMMILAVAVGVGGWPRRLSKAHDARGSAVLTEDGVIARNADGSEKWRHEFVGEIATPRDGRAGRPIAQLGGDGLLAATETLVRRDNRAIRGGQLFWFDPVGRIRQVFSFEDHVPIGSRFYGAPWCLTDYRLSENHGTRLIAVAAHHTEWWPSIVTVLDDQWHRKGSFVHAGWVEQVGWLPGGRLAIAGFSNLKNGGMVALLDANTINGQSPVPRGSEFECATCGPDRPLRYLVLPRSEVNRVSAAPFNRATLTIRADAVVVTTQELSDGESPAFALYEFTQQLNLIHVGYSDRYWQAHQDLERLGKISHTRDQCPERDGPPPIDIWEPATGWRTQVLHRPTSAARPDRDHPPA